ncbi:ras-domain-containing protein [Exidia glandulosa HHB12029]|uniref:Ras-domain-containing protein n=1 Tax=Exidia glandulosa HHB12029 TaxID=1314781 RepID=A0A165H4D8_EXIGL|nr:ras-domain-containing protein [Exidia glandulosa HHB12029]
MSTNPSAQFLREYKLAVVGGDVPNRRQCVIDDENALLDVLDTVAQEGATREQNARTIEGFLLVYSITSRSSFEEVPRFHQQILRVTDKDSLPIIVVGNKCDLEYERQVGETEGRDLAKQCNCNFIETSAKQRINVDEAFASLVREIRRYNKEQQNGCPNAGPNTGGPAGTGFQGQTKDSQFRLRCCGGSHLLSPSSSMPYVGPKAVGAFAGIFLETLFTGAFLVVAYDCARALHLRARKRHRRTFRYLCATFATLFVLIIMRTIVDLERTIHSFSNPSDDGKIDLGAPASAESLLTNLLLVLITVVADTFLIYRLFVVWSNSLLVAFVPVLLLLGETGGGVYVVYALAAAGGNITKTVIDHIGQSFATFLYFTLATNLVCTVLIAGRIWWIRHQTRRARATGESPIALLMTLVVESAAVYSALLIPEIISIAYDLPSVYVFINMIGPVVGIVFSHIIIRASQTEQCSTNDIESKPSVGSTSRPFSSGIRTPNIHVLDSFAPGYGVDLEEGDGGEGGCGGSFVMVGDVEPREGRKGSDVDIGVYAKSRKSGQEER